MASKIIWSEIDEAPALATFAFLPVVQAFCKGTGVDVETKEPDVALRERSDVCAVPRAGVVCEQMVAIVLAQEAQRMFGGDTVEDFVRNHRAYVERLAAF